MEIFVNVMRQDIMMMAQVMYVQHVITVAEHVQVQVLHNVLIVPFLLMLILD
jgi:hypothetical protein